jgi:hypothetical protein
MTADMFTIPEAARVEWPSTRAWRLLWADTEETPIYDAVAAVFGRVEAAS